jgi:DnaD/phage-associated family protein
LPSQPFPGFPARSRLTPLPDLFFSRLLPETESLTELKVVLHIFWRLYQRKDGPKFVTYDDLLRDETLVAGLAGTAASAAVLREALDSAVSRGALLHTVLEDSGQPRDAYFINSEAGRNAVSGLQSGSPVPGRAQRQAPGRPEAPNIFTLYEQNIGLLTPMIVEELKEAESLYPAPWIEDAFREAATLNKRSWRYIARILERWSVEGKGSGESGRDPKKKRGPERYLGGRYGHLVRH